MLSILLSARSPVCYWGMIIIMTVVKMMTVMMIDSRLAPLAHRLPEDSEQCESLIPLHAVSQHEGSFCSWSGRPAQSKWFTQLCVFDLRVVHWCVCLRACVNVDDAFSQPGLRQNPRTDVLNHFLSLYIYIYGRSMPAHFGSSSSCHGFSWKKIMLKTSIKSTGPWTSCSCTPNTFKVMNF